jgi:Coenzyme PQQ synthesis protein D (PqqD)
MYGGVWPKASLRLRSRAYREGMVTGPRPAEGVRVEDFDDDVCLFRRDIDEVVVLNSSAGDVWRLADGQTSVAQMVTLLSRAYAVPSVRLEPEVHDVVAQLVARGYLVETA